MPLAPRSFWFASPHPELDTRRALPRRRAERSVPCVHEVLLVAVPVLRAAPLRRGAQRRRPRTRRLPSDLSGCRARHPFGNARKYASCSWVSASLHETRCGSSSRSVHTRTTTRLLSHPRLMSRCSPYASRSSSRVSIGSSKTPSQSARSIACLRRLSFRLAGS